MFWRRKTLWHPFFIRFFIRLYIFNELFRNFRNQGVRLGSCGLLRRSVMTTDPNPMEI